MYMFRSKIPPCVVLLMRPARTMAKHKSVLWQNTFKQLLKSVLPKQKVFWQNRKCFQSVGIFSNIGDSKKILWNCAKTFFLCVFSSPSLFPPNPVFSILWKNTLRLKLRHIVALSQLETERNYTRTTHSNLRVLVQFAFKLG